MTIREITENIEKNNLSEFATLSVNTKGREKFEEKCEMRTDFQRDRDRVIHCKSFRRLKHKTQVFLSPESDHYRTRLTHTLEVSQIARTIARALRLNEDLTEAIALAHDLGHTPFGHAGERVLDGLVEGGFTHYEQGVRVCRKIEKGGQGLNLTAEVLDGILNHAKGDWPATPEGKIVRFSDRIAYINHDIDDAIAAGIITEESLPKEATDYLGKNKSKRINSLVKSIITSSEGADIKMDDTTAKYYGIMHDYLFDSVYTNPTAKSEESKVVNIITGIFEHIIKNPDVLTDEYKIICETDGVSRAAADYIAGMTDHFAVSTFEDIYIPKFWKM
ncbi:MAG: deoxyguanosinetriphosphate triphosphohydrolase [Clostridia bacterium]|nr:deoxyguanosinetriphosphate triphosphohydrolase [Clostridia bacterium]